MTTGTMLNTLRKLTKIGGIVLHPVIPPDLILFVTSRCNATCDFCLFHEQVHDRERKRAELTVEEIERIAAGYGGLTKLSLSGGEPFLRHDIARIVAAFGTGSTYSCSRSMSVIGLPVRRSTASTVGMPLTS